MASGYVLTSDAVRDLEEIEDYVEGYAGVDFAARLEEQFFGLFELLAREPLRHPVYQLVDGEGAPLHEYRSANLYHYKVFYYVREADGTVVVYRVRHLVSDFTRLGW